MSTLSSTITLAAASLGTTPLLAESPAIAPTGHHIPGPIHQHHVHADDADHPIGAAISIGFDSRYVSEGRDNLDGDSLLHGTLELNVHDLSFGVWYADSPENPYNEFNLWLEYGFRLGDVDFHVGFNHLRFPDDNSHDNEIGIGASYGELPWGLSAGVDAYYSFAVEGTFLEAALTRAFTPCDWLTLEPGIVLGRNEGYVSSGHRGANHVAAVISAMVPLGDQVELTSYLSYNMAIDSDPIRSPDDALLKDFLYGGLAVSFVF